MLLRDPAPLGEKFQALLTHMKEQNFNWLHGNLHAIYGDSFDTHQYDVILMTEGLIRVYSECFVLTQQTFDFKKLAYYIVDRIDDLFAGLSAKQVNPLMTQMPSLSAKDVFLLTEIKRHVQKNKDNLSADIPAAIDAIEKEMNREKPQKIVLESMATYLDGVPEIEDEWKQLKWELKTRSEA